MPKIVVEIEWDYPEDEHWLNADNVALALHAYCKRTKFAVNAVPNAAMQVEVARLREEKKA